MYSKIIGVFKRCIILPEKECIKNKDFKLKTYIISQHSQFPPP